MSLATATAEREMDKNRLNQTSQQFLPDQSIERKTTNKSKGTFNTLNRFLAERYVKHPQKFPRINFQSDRRKSLLKALQD